MQITIYGQVLTKGLKQNFLDSFPGVLELRCFFIPKGRADFGSTIHGIFTDEPTPKAL